MTLQRTFDHCLQAIISPNNEVYVIKSNEIVGFGIISFQGFLVGYIRIIAFKPEFRNMGLGTKMISFLEHEIFKRFPNAFICASSFNPGARRLYERLGYEYVGELKDFFMKGYSEFLLRKTLGPIINYQPSKDFLRL